MVRFYLLLGLSLYEGQVTARRKERIPSRPAIAQKYPHFALKGGAIFSERRGPTKTVNGSPLLSLILQTKIL